jgi:hypothetical protein
MLFESAAYMSASSVLNVCSALAMGAALSMRFFFPFLSVVECGAAAAPLGLTLSVWVSIVLKTFVFSAASGLPAVMANVGSVIHLLVAAACLPGARARLDKRGKQFVAASVRSVRLPLIVCGVIGGWLSYLHYTHSLGKWGDGYYVGGTVYGDMPFHLGVISSLLWGANR